MAHRAVMFGLYAAGAAASAAIIAGGVALIAIRLQAPPAQPAAFPPTAAMRPANPAQAAPSPATAAQPPAAAPGTGSMTGDTPTLATNGRMTIRLVTGQPER